MGDLIASFNCFVYPIGAMMDRNVVREFNGNAFVIFGPKKKDQRG